MRTRIFTVIVVVIACSVLFVLRDWAARQTVEHASALPPASEGSAQTTSVRPAPVREGGGKQLPAHVSASGPGLPRHTSIGLVSASDEAAFADLPIAHPPAGPSIEERAEAAFKARFPDAPSEAPGCLDSETDETSASTPNAAPAAHRVVSADQRLPPEQKAHLKEPANAGPPTVVTPVPAGLLAAQARYEREAAQLEKQLAGQALEAARAALKSHLLAAF